MKTILFLLIATFIIQAPPSPPQHYHQHSSISNNFTQCLSLNSPPQILNSPHNSSYKTILESRIQNLVFSSDTTPKPLFIVTPLLTSHVQATIACSKQNGINLRTLSGGHDYEGLSYTATTDAPFVVLDLINFRSIRIDLNETAAWVESGASLGELYYRVAEASPVLGFPAGICPTVGVGGHFSGGGFGMLVRKYGLAADQIIDARVVDSNGRVLDRESMGEDLFWAIRGGGGSSFCVVLSWKVKLVHVPKIVTVFNFAKRLDKHGTMLFHKWQFVSPKLDENVYLRVVIEEESGDDLNNVGPSSPTVLELRFNCMFLGRANELVEIMEEKFPELGLNESDCSEVSWIESVMYFSGYPEGSPIEALVERAPQPKYFYKAKSDFVKEPLPMLVLEKLWEWCVEGERSPVLIMEPFGGRMDEISESEIPFPHRNGNLYNIQYYVKWKDGESSERHIGWIRRVYERMSPYVTSNPRASYVNYRDLDLGVNHVNGSSSTTTTTYDEAERWGLKYFKGNFKRLAIVKGQVDPLNFFKDEQSVPPLFLDGRREVM